MSYPKVSSSFIYQDLSGTCAHARYLVPEAEDLDIGEENDLAADVDDGDDDAASDPEGLDSSDDEELGDLDMIDETSEGESHSADHHT